MSRYRLSFVTNSSSSSFVCEVCGASEGGYEVSRSDVGFAQCENGHEFCERHTLSPEVTTDMLKKELQEALDTHLRWAAESTNKRSASRYRETAAEYQEKLSEVNQMEPDDIRSEYLALFDELPAVFCPICALGVVRDSDILMYIQRKTGVKTTEVEREIQQQFGTLDELKKYLEED